METYIIPTPEPYVNDSARAEADTRSIMVDVIIALVPVLMVAVYYFGWRALALTLVSVVSCVAFEGLYRFLLHKPSSLRDLSAVVTGLLAVSVAVSPGASVLAPVGESASPWVASSTWTPCRVVLPVLVSR